MFSHYIHHVWTSGWFTLGDIGLLLCLDTPVCSLSYQWCHLSCCTSEYNVPRDILKVNISFSTKGISFALQYDVLFHLRLSWWISPWLVFFLYNCNILVCKNGIYNNGNRYVLISNFYENINYDIIKEISRIKVLFLYKQHQITVCLRWF